MERVVYAEQFGIPQHGLDNIGKVYWNLSSAQLYELVVLRREGKVAEGGSIIVRTGHYTGRSPKDRFIVREPSSQDHIAWGKDNQPISEDTFDKVFTAMKAFLHGTDMFAQDCYCGQDPQYRIPVRVLTETAWHSLFARNMFCRINDRRELAGFQPEWTVVHAPGFEAIPAQHGTNSEAFVLIHLGKKLVLIGGTKYAGEIKKSIFSVMNYRMPFADVLPMHCSANVGNHNDTAIFFGLSGTGKTTLSADPKRSLIGDDEHGWSDNGVFNFEAGCYAKVIRLNPKAEPEIWNTTRMFGTILENVVMNAATREIDLDNEMLTENTRASYPNYSIPNAIPEGTGPHPRNIIMLTCDAFGVLPPVSRLTREQAMYHFISGYTARVAGTERGVTEPQATFSTCFGGPFMPLRPQAYAELLGKKMDKYKVDCWLVNTGWGGGPYGVGKRISIQDTRAIIYACLDGSLSKVKFQADPFFGLQVPTECAGVDPRILMPRNTWHDKAAYDATAAKVAGLFHENIKKFAGLPADIVNAGPPKA